MEEGGALRVGGHPGDGRVAAQSGLEQGGELVEIQLWRLLGETGLAQQEGLRAGGGH